VVKEPPTTKNENKIRKLYPEGSPKGEKDKAVTLEETGRSVGGITRSNPQLGDRIKAKCALRGGKKGATSEKNNLIDLE